MQTRGIFPAVLLITVGVIFLGENYGWFHLDWSIFSRFWPLLLVLAGVNIILRRRQSSAAVVTTILLAIAVPLAIVSAMRSNNGDFQVGIHDNDRWNDSEEEDEEEAEESKVQINHFAEPMDSTIRQATLKFEGGAGFFTIGTASDSLVEANSQVTVTNYSMSVEKNDNNAAVVSMRLNDDQVNLKRGKLKNRVDLKLNDKPFWDFDLDFGAGQADLDLSSYAVRSLDLETGAAKIDLKLGDKAAESDIKISSGVAALTIRVPRTVGCQIEADGALNVKNFEGFNEVSDGIYQSSGYTQSTKKITIRYESGISKIRVERY
ncbi:LiaF transmembrane domain-containing protein [Tellurirhabdus bombi]|uniref:LiaF transmembrane domain-containing protein n=1 Tax=Tellurirhabdus bombi TaxID=2907205 RepID=UPI001F447F52|nr:DUF5668 domain-containing protein [Tellurirhabdus bombi]